MRVETCVDCMAKWPRLFASTRKLLKKTHFKATNDLRSTCINLRWVAKPWKTCADLRANLIPTKVNASHYEWTRVRVSRGKNRVAGTDKFKTCDYLRLCLFIQKGRIFLYFKSAEVEPLYFLVFRFSPKLQWGTAFLFNAVRETLKLKLLEISDFFSTLFGQFGPLVS